MWVKLDEEFAAKRAEVAVKTEAQADETAQAQRRTDTLNAIPFERRAANAVDRLRKQRSEALTAGELEEWASLRRLDLAWHQDVLAGREEPVFAETSHEVSRNALRAVLDGEGAAAFASATAKLDLAEPISMAALIDRWAADREPTLKTLEKARKVMAEVEGIAGPLTTAQLTPHVAQSYKDHLTASGKAKATGNNKLGLFRAVCRFARQNRLVVGDPCDGINITATKKRKGVDGRIAFDTSALAAIVSSPVYGVEQRPVAGGGEAAYWLPLLALYTGARQRELGQLRVKDIAEEPYLDDSGDDARAWVIRLVFDAADALQPDGLPQNRAAVHRLKNEGSERRVPIHAALIELGFLRYVDTMRETGHGRVFPDLLPDKYGNVAASWSKWFGRWLRGTCKITDKRMVFHSFRHTFKHYARYSLIAPDVQNEITGHETGDIADDYGGLSFPLHPLVEGMKRYRVPSFQQPAPPWSGRTPQAQRQSVDRKIGSA
jgi:integrase